MMMPSNYSGGFRGKKAKDAVACKTAAGFENSYSGQSLSGQSHQPLVALLHSVELATQGR